MRVAMGDIGAEPSMEEILSSIKRIIAEEGDGIQPRGRKPQRSPVSYSAPPRAAENEEVLELSEPMPMPQPAPQPVAQAVSQLANATPAPPPADPIVSHQAAAASRGSLDALSRLVVKPEGAPASADNTLEGLVREMLRPMLRDWLDAHLPDIVEAMVSREIERITGTRQG